MLGPFPKTCGSENRENLELKVRRIIEKLKHGSVNLHAATFEDSLWFCEVTDNEYMMAVISVLQTQVFLKRSPGEIFINTYVPKNNLDEIKHGYSVRSACMWLCVLYNRLHQLK
jgi:hypothetical protein